MANVAGTFIWYELMTTDVEAAARFYGEVVGWKVAQRGDADGSGRDYRMIGRSDGGTAGGMLQLTPDLLSHGARPLWMGYLAVPDVDAATSAIEADGGNTLMSMELPVGRIAMVADPMGSPFYVMNPVPPPGQPDALSDAFDTDATQHVRWNELASPDLVRAKAFYAKHFGFAFNEVMPMGPLGDYCFIDHGGQRVGAIMQKPAHSPFAAWQFYFGVDSIAAAQRAVEARGGKVLNGPHQVPRGDWVLMATDPQGAPFGIVAPNQ